MVTSRSRSRMRCWLSRFHCGNWGMIFSRLSCRGAVTVFPVLERRRDGALEVLQHPLHVLAQLDADPGRKPQRARLVRLVEVVDVAPVGGRLLAGGLLFQKHATHPAA